MNTYYDLFEGSQLKTVKCIAEISKCQTLVNRHGRDRLVTIILIIRPSKYFQLKIVALLKLPRRVLERLIFKLIEN